MHQVAHFEPSWSRVLYRRTSRKISVRYQLKLLASLTRMTFTLRSEYPSQFHLRESADFRKAAQDKSQTARFFRERCRIRGSIIEKNFIDNERKIIGLAELNEKSSL